MSKSMVEYEIYIPANSQGKAVERKLLNRLKQKLVNKFGGITDTSYKSKGIWKLNGVTYFDEVIIWKILSSNKKDLRFIKNYKSEAEKALKQKQILIVSKNIIQIL